MTLEKNKLLRDVTKFEPAKVFEMKEKYVSPLPQGRKYNVKNMRNVEIESALAFMKNEVLTYRGDIKKKLLTIQHLEGAVDPQLLQDVMHQQEESESLEDEKVTTEEEEDAEPFTQRF